MKWLAMLVFASLVSCHQVDVPYPTSCHKAIPYSIEPRYYCLWQRT